MHEDLAAIVNDIAARQKLLKDSLPKLTREKARNALQAQVDRLEALRAELIPTKQTSIFADETRLREDITEVYVAVCSNEQAPTNLQLERVKRFVRFRVLQQLRGRAKPLMAHTLVCR